MQSLFRTMVHVRGITSIFVTHDVKEALLIGDVFGPLRGGRLHVYPDRKGFRADLASDVGREAERVPDRVGAAAGTRRKR